jgi:plastocyanin
MACDDTTTARRATAPSDGTITRRGFLRGAGAVGGGGAVVAGAADSAAAQEATTHQVDMTDGLVFDPDSLTIAPGDTVVWETVGSVGHSVTAYEDEQPEGLEFWSSGDLDSEQAARDAYPDEGDVAAGETYEHTFETEGVYPYFCIPHEAAGMVAELEVVEGGAAPEGGGGPAIPQVPDSAKSLAVAVSTAMLSVLALAWFFIKYGGDYDTAGETGE